jgi:hypothetical protein
MACITARSLPQAAQRLDTAVPFATMQFCNVPVVD